MALTDRLTSIADAIRAKSGKTEKLSLAQMPVEIANIQTGVELNFTVVGGITRPNSAPDTLTWDGNIENRTSFRLEEDGMTLVLVSNATPTSTELANGGTICTSTLGEHSFSTSDMVSIGECVMILSGVLICYNAGAILGDGTVLSEAGTYFVLTDGMYVSSITIPGYTGFSAKENTIWVNTDEEITGWYFSAENPFIGSIAESAGTDLGSVEVSSFEPILYSFKKVNDGKAAMRYCFIKNDETQYGGVMLLSREKDACAILRTGTYTTSGNDAGTTTIEATNSIVHNGQTYYYAYAFVVTISNTTGFVDPYTSYEELAEALLPTYFMDGAVWFKTDANADVSFNALRKNGIQIYPVSATHFTSGECAEKTAQVYRNGEWVELTSWNGELYDAGNQYEDVTGGWVVGEGNATATIDDAGITLSTTSNSANRIHVETKKAVDLTDYNTLYANVTITSLSLGSGISNICCRLGHASVSGTSLASASTKVEEKATAKGEVTLQLDISEVTGEHYVVFGIGYFSVAVTVNKIWME